MLFCRNSSVSHFGVTCSISVINSAIFSLLNRAMWNTSSIRPTGRESALTFPEGTPPDHRGPTTETGQWAIESAFAVLKSRGFNLEATHMTQPERLALLMMVLAVGLMWCLLVGRQQHQHTPIRRKKHGRRVISLFRLGLDRLRDAIYNREHRPLDFPHFCQILVSCT